MKKIMYINFPQGSHILSSVYLCNELAKEDVKLIYYTDPKYFNRFSDKIEMRPYPENFFKLYRKFASNLRLYHSMITLYWVFMQFTKELAPFILKEVEREKPDFIICDHLAIWGKMALKKYKIPAFFYYSNLFYRSEDKSMTFGMIFAELFKAATVNLPYVFGIIKAIRQLKRRHGVVVWNPEEIFDNKNDFDVVMNSRYFQPNGESYTPNYHFIGPGQFDPAHFEKKKEVIFIFIGTVESDKEFWEVCFDAFRGKEFSNYEILASFGGTVNFQFEPGQVPKNFKLVNNLTPQEYMETLKRSALFISHGGINSVLESLTFLTPLITITNAFQNHPVGKRAQDLGCAINFHRSKLTVESLREAALKILNNSSFYENAAKVRQSFIDAMPERKAIVQTINREFHLF